MAETPSNAVKTEGNDAATLDDVLAAVGNLRSDYRHTDEFLHRIDQGVARVLSVLDDHAPLLARARTLMDPGAGVRKFMARKGEGSHGR